jgi:hypothetical protein
MTITAETQQQIEAFFRSIGSKNIAYANAQFCYLAVKADAEFRIIQARLLFNSVRPAANIPPV